MQRDLQIRILERLLDEAKTKKKLDLTRGTGYHQATEDNLELNTDNDGVIDPTDKERVKKFFKALGLIP